MPTMHELIFGDSLDQTVGYLVGRAVRENMKDGYLKAAHKLEGIRSLLIFMESESNQRTRMTYAHVALGNEIRRMYRMADDDAIRTKVARLIAEQESTIETRNR